MQNKLPDDDEFDDNPVISTYYGSNSFAGDPTKLFQEVVGTLNADDKIEDGPWTAATDDKENIYATERVIYEDYNLDFYT